MRVSIWGALFALCAAAAVSPAILAQQKTLACPARPAAGSVVREPKDLRSTHGELRVELRYRTRVDGAGQTHLQGATIGYR